MIWVLGVENGRLRKSTIQNPGYQEVYSVAGMKDHRRRDGYSFAGPTINKYTLI